MMRGASAFLWVTAISAPVSAQSDWVHAATGANEWFVRRADTKNETNQSPTVWTKIDGSRDKTVKWRTAMQQFRFDCIAQTSTTLATIMYAADGSVSYSRSYQPFEQVAEPMAPDTVILSVAKKVCPSGAIP